MFNYIQVTGGNKYQYKLTHFDEDNGLNIGIENALKKTLKEVWNAYANQQQNDTKPKIETQPQEEDKTEIENINLQTEATTPPIEQKTKRKRIFYIFY